MKTSPKDDYLFSQKSTSKKAGFECFQNKQSKKYYFHFNDEKGKALLYSQAYTTTTSRDKGLLSVQKNMLQPARYENKKEAAVYFFSIKAGNYQEIARSRFFDSKTSMLDYMEYAKGFSMHESNHLKTAPQKIKKEEIPSSKYGFRIDIYPIKDPMNLKGKIEYISTGEKEVFEQLQTDQITRFIRAKLELPPVPVMVQKTLLKENNIPKEKLPEPQQTEQPILYTEQQAEQRLEDLEKEKVDVQIIMPDSPLPSTEKKETIQVKIDVPPDAIQKVYFYKVCLELNSIKQKSQVLRLEYSDIIPDDKQLVFPLPADHLLPDLYRLNAEIQFGKTKRLSNYTTNALTGSNLFMIY